MTHEEIIREFEDKAFNTLKDDCWLGIDGGFSEKSIDWLDKTLTTYRAQVLEEERQFILNVLDGIDIADKQMGNKGGGTKAIRFALQSRTIQPTKKEWRYNALAD